ncbi:MAG: MBL fold metallo-hydrolase, partial [Candidatus Hodarchaeota archaeon]
KYQSIYDLLWSDSAIKQSTTPNEKLSSSNFSVEEIYQLAFLLHLVGGLKREELVHLVRRIYLSDEWETFMINFVESLFCHLKLQNTAVSSLGSKLALELEFFGISFSVIGTEVLSSATEKYFGSTSSIQDLFNILSLLAHLKERPEYLDEITQDLQLDETIAKFSQWATYEEMYRISNAIIKQVAEEVKEKIKHKKISLDKIEKEISPILERKNATGLPLAYIPFLQMIQDFLEPLTVRMDDLGNIRPELVQQYVPKRAFSIKKKKIQIEFPGGSNIGHSGVVLRINDRTILMDFGLSVMNHTIPRWNIALEAIDCILISHSHLDHIGALPLLYGLGLKEHWFAVPPTNTISRILLRNNSVLFKERVPSLAWHSELQKITSQTNIATTMDHFVPIGYGKREEVSPDIYVTAFQASHIFGSAGFLIEALDKRIFYTGDFNLDPTALFPKVEFPIDADCYIIDGTYYDALPFAPKLTDKILQKAILEYKRTIIPAFTVGRAQEVLLRLDRLNLLKDHRAILIGMANQVAKLADIQVPYSSETITLENFEENMIVIAGAGMLSGGTARTLLEGSRNDPKTSVVICGYQAPGTLGQSLRDGFPLAKERYSQPVFNARMSAHSSSETLRKWLKELPAKKKVLIHYPGDRMNDKKTGIVVPSVTHPKIEL